ncbi:MAG: hypothetical protein P9E24_09695, partial [Candidatus Competibacter sp.]|nr:hypothetical protein [Candidatus Competibacter sp.]MDG4585457.1 hypothetical protein [Candidatus Competibacter sp.]
AVKAFGFSDLAAYPPPRYAYQRKGEIAMKTRFLSLLAVVVLTVGGCAGTTPIKNLPLPPVTTIEGTVTQLDENGFTLTDNSGSIFVRAKLPDNKKLGLSMDEKVKVYGNLQGGQEKIFDGYVIKKSSGEQIIVSNPTPHFGFIIQSSFK